jgi:hypothetical protein
VSGRGFLVSPDDGRVVVERGVRGVDSREFACRGAGASTGSASLGASFGASSMIVSVSVTVDGAPETGCVSSSAPGDTVAVTGA